MRVIRNDWSRVTVPGLAGWRPELTVSVVIPAYQCQATLDLTLAALSRQTYPAELLEVVVVDDGSDPPLHLPPLRPARTTLVRADEGSPGSPTSGWGRAHALRCGAAASSGAILHWLDADMLPFPEHVAAQARWHHALPYAVTLGYKRFVEPAPLPSPETVAERWRRGAAAALFGGDSGEPHDYVERYIAQTDQLRAADHLAFRIHVGATAALRRELYDAAGGPDPQLRLGEDIELGYRFAQAGAVFVPEPAARSWHLGRTQVMRARERVDRYNRPFLADRIPYPRHWRSVGGPTRSVPLAEVVVPAAGQPLERVRAAVDSVLRGDEADVRVDLVGPWDTLDDARVPVLADPALELRLVAATYCGEPRVRLVTRAPESAFPAPYLLELPAGCGLAPDGLRRLVDLADRHQAGVVRAELPGAAGPPGAADAPGAAYAPGAAAPGAADLPGSAVRAALLWRTAALGRVRWVRSDGESVLDTVTAVYGRRDVAAAAAGVVDLARLAPAELARGIPAGSARGRRPALVPTTVEVAGVRSWARATVVVAWLTVRRARVWLLRQQRFSHRRRLAGH